MMVMVSTRYLVVSQLLPSVGLKFPSTRWPLCQEPRTFATTRLGTMSSLRDASDFHQRTVRWRGCPGLCNIERFASFYPTAHYKVSFQAIKSVYHSRSRDFHQGCVLHILEWPADIERNPSGPVTHVPCCSWVFIPPPTLANSKRKVSIFQLKIIIPVSLGGYSP